MKQPMTTEQKVVRAAAVLGSIITFIGACFGVALAIQSGLLGPVGRAVGAFLFALILLGVGVRIDIRRGAQPGVTALYMTSFLVIQADLIYMTQPQEWLSPTGLSITSLALWIAFLGLAIWRKNLWLVLCMCISTLFFGGPVFGPNAASALLTMSYPLLALLSSWAIPSVKTPNLAFTTRLMTAEMLIHQLVLLASITNFEDSLESVAVFNFVGIFLLILGDRYFPIRQLSPTTRNWTSIYAPAAVILMSYTVIWRVSLWVPVVVALAATILVGVLWFRSRGPEEAEHANRSLTGWLGMLPFTFVPVVFDTGADVERKMISESIAVIVFFVVFTAVLVLVRYRAAHRVPLLTAWSVALFLVVHEWIPGTLSSSLARFLPAYDLAVGLALIAFLGFAASQFWLWRSLKPVERNLFAAGGLLFSVVGIVTASTAIGELISPNVFGLTATKRGVILSEEYAFPQGFQVGFFVGHMIVSISWMALAAWLLVKRPKPGTDPKAARVAGLVIAVCATAKLVLFDMASLSGIPRVITFVVCGLLLIAVAVLGAQRNGGSTGRSESALDGFWANENAVPSPYAATAPHGRVGPLPNGEPQPAFAEAPQPPQDRNPGTESQASQISVGVSRGPEHAPEQEQPQGPLPERSDTASEKTEPAADSDRSADRGASDGRDANGRDASGRDAADPESSPS